MSRKIQLVISDEADKVLGTHAGERKRGAYVSQAIVHFAKPAPPTGLFETMALQISSLTAKLDKLLTQGQ